MKTFSIGGVHPKENKISENAAIEDFPLPKEVIVFTLQHLGVPAVPVVEKGQKVKTGELLAKGEAFLSANIHSPVSGTIQKIDFVAGINGYKQQAIFIEVEGDEWLETIDRSPKLEKEIKLSKEEIIEKIKEMGIVGLGGACFPTHIKYMIPSDKKADYLIINGAECEPYLTSDYRVMLEKAEETFVGIQILKKALGVEMAYVGIENNKRDAIEKLSELAKSYPGIEIQTLKTKYPQGAEKQLIKAITKRVVPSGKLPIDVGCVVNNLGTALAVYEAVQKNKPLIDNILTITGSSLPVQKNYKVRIGIPFSALLESVGGMPADTVKAISGGPMMGKTIQNLDAPIVKGTSSLLLLTEKEGLRKPEKDCIRCATCVQVCPMGLEPYYLNTLSLYKKTEETGKEKILDCIECGCCLFSCPANIPLLDSIRLGKSALRQQMQKK